MKALLCRSFGPLANLEIEEVAEPRQGTGELLLEIEAAGVNFPDGLIVKGEYQIKPPLPFIPGTEVVGTILATGADVKDLEVGDRVIAMCLGGGFAERVVVRADQAVPVPLAMPAGSAAGFILAYGTAFHALQDKAKIKPGETLLVLGAAGGVGLAAVEVGKAMGATVIAAASSSEKLELARVHGADVLINYVAEDLKEALRRIVPRGVDVVFDPVGGSMTEAAVRNLRWEGRLLVVGFTQGAISKLPVNLLLLREASAIGVFFGQFISASPTQHHANLQQLFVWYDQGKIKPHVGDAYSLYEARTALGHVMERRAIGKVVLVMSGSDEPTPANSL